MDKGGDRTAAVKSWVLAACLPLSRRGTLSDPRGMLQSSVCCSAETCLPAVNILLPAAVAVCLLHEFASPLPLSASNRSPPVVSFLPSKNSALKVEEFRSDNRICQLQNRVMEFYKQQEELLGSICLLGGFPGLGRQ